MSFAESIKFVRIKLNLSQEEIELQQKIEQYRGGQKKN